MVPYFHRRPNVLRLAVVTALSFGLLAGCKEDEALPDVSLVRPATGGSGNGGGTATGLPIGERCTSNGECASGLCLRPDDAKAVLTSGTVPGGLCTAPCESSADCRAENDDAACVAFAAGSFCVQSCRFGTPGIGEEKCGRRAELSCQPTLADGAPECNDDEECSAPYLCFEGTCSLLPVCLPRCNSDNDCPADRYCNPRDGECVTARPTGKLPGETCDPDASEDECRGRCLSFGDGISECDEGCTVGAPGGCGYPDALTAPVVCAFYAYDLGVPQGVLDEGSCAQLCRCNDECPGVQLCLPDPEGGPLGVCVSGLAPEDSVEECPAE